MTRPITRHTSYAGYKVSSLSPTCSLGLLHDQLSHGDRDDRAPCQRENIHVQEADALPQLDRRANQRSVNECGQSFKVK